MEHGLHAADHRGDAGEGIHVHDEDIARLSPLKFARINFHGRYSFALPAEVQGGQLRSIRKPETASTTIQAGPAGSFDTRASRQRTFSCDRPA